MSRVDEKERTDERIEVPYYLTYKTGFLQPNPSDFIILEPGFITKRDLISRMGFMAR
jgi:hypothetical protein